MKIDVSVLKTSSWVFFLTLKCSLYQQNIKLTKFSRAIFAVVMPLEDGNGGPLSIEIPVTYDIDSGE